MTAFMDGLLRWWPLPFLLIQVVMAWVMWSLERRFVSQKDYKVDKEKNELKLCELERGTYTAPSRAEIMALADQLNALGGKISNLGGRLDGINRAVDLLNQHHLRTSE